MFASVPIWGVVVGALSAMVIGTVWYSPYMFGKRWSAALGVNDEQMKKSMAKVTPILLVASLLTAYVLALFIVYFMVFTRYSALKSGLVVSLLAAVGFASTALVAHGVFDPRPKDALYINIGNRFATLLIMGMIISLFIQ